MGVTLRLSKMFKIVFLGSILLLQVHSLPRTGQGKIDWSKIQPKRLSVDSWNGKTDLPQDVLVKKILAANEQAPESYPGYKKEPKVLQVIVDFPDPRTGLLVVMRQPLINIHGWLLFSSMTSGSVVEPLFLMNGS